MKDLVPRIATYPIMTPGGLDYAEGHTYETTQASEPAQGKNTIGVLHRVCGDNLVSQLLRQGSAEFACTIVSPWCAYRSVEKATGTLENYEGSIQIEQQVEIATDQFSHPVMFQPSIITNTDIEPFTAQSSHGLDGLWVGERLIFPVAAMIALQPFWNAKTVMQSILRMKKVSDNRLTRGSFEVKDVWEQGFYFLVEVEQSLFDGLRNPASFEHRNSIYSMALAQGFGILRESLKEEQDSWKEQQNLKLLYQMLKDRDEFTWEDDEFSPNQAAAAFHPHMVKLAQELEPD